MLSREDVVEYQKIYKKVHGKEISYEQALEEGIKLIRLFEIILKPLNKDLGGKLQTDEQE